MENIDPKDRAYAYSRGQALGQWLKKSLQLLQGLLKISQLCNRHKLGGDIAGLVRSTAGRCAGCSIFRDEPDSLEVHVQPDELPCQYHSPNRDHQFFSE